MTAAKSYFGNLGAAGGMIELIASLLSMQEGRLFPTLNYETPDPHCDLHIVVDDSVPTGDKLAEPQCHATGAGQRGDHQAIG